MRTILLSALAGAYVIFEAVWATALVAALLREFCPQTNFNFFLLLGLCAVVLNAAGLLIKFDPDLKAALRVNTFMWLVILTVVELSTGIL
jgi:hypothetical protein